MKTSEKEYDFFSKVAFVLIYTGLAFLIAAAHSRWLWRALFDGLYPAGAADPIGRELAVQNSINLIMYVMPSAFGSAGLGLFVAGALIFLSNMLRDLHCRFRSTGKSSSRGHEHHE